METNYPGDTPLTRFLSTQTVAQLREIRSEYKAEIEASRSRVAALDAELAVIERAIHEKSGGRARRSVASSNGGPRRGGPSLRETILQVMREGGGVWNKQRLLNELDSRGLTPSGKTPKNTIGSRLLEMASRGEIQKVSRGTYAIPSTAAREAVNDEEVPAM
jgi:hypothetical protein